MQFIPDNLYKQEENEYEEFEYLKLYIKDINNIEWMYINKNCLCDICYNNKAVYKTYQLCDYKDINSDIIQKGYIYVNYCNKCKNKEIFEKS